MSNEIDTVIMETAGGERRADTAHRVNKKHLYSILSVLNDIYKDAEPQVGKWVGWNSKCLTEHENAIAKTQWYSIDKYGVVYLRRRKAK